MRELQDRLDSLQTLGEAVGAMKSVSAHHFREARRALEPTRAYREGLQGVLRSTGALLPAGSGGVGLVVLGGELGFCGSYNARVTAEAVRLRREHGPGPTYCVGRRAESHLRRQGVEPDRTYSAPTVVGGATELLLRLAADILGDYVEQDLSAFDLLANRFQGVGSFEPRAARLLPVVVSRADDAPVARYVSAGHLADVAVREALYITMVELLLDAMTSEHGARLVATQSAEHWLDGRVTELRRRLSSARREANTQEVIEVASGVRARARAARHSGLPQDAEPGASAGAHRDS
ncbi:MAG: FoF1 ATP synthase subunit gamma [Myxococcales bacterium]|jgi:F-type H+-transporting ATPase subunit gamma